MDEIALLCNLHADGPATLKVLRRAGLRTLSQVSAFDVRKLSDTLGVSPSFARRFAREARLLAGRMGAEGLEMEEAAPIPPVAEPHTSTAHEPIAREVHRPREESFAPRAITPAERPAIVAPAGTRLVSYVVAGLDRHSCDRLLAQGIRTLEELAVAPGLALARRLEMPLTRLLDLQYLAQQRIAAPESAESDPNAATTEREYVLHPIPRASGTTARIASAPEDELPTWRTDIGHLQPPLRVSVSTDTEVAGPFA